MTHEGIVVRVGRRLFVHIDVPWVHAFADTCEAVRLDDVVLLDDIAVFVDRSVGEAVITERKF